MSHLADADRLYRRCFTVYGNEPEIILGFAEQHGQISFITQDGKSVGMVCHAEICDRGINAIYIFAACVLPEYRGLGLFKNKLAQVIGKKEAVLIPENESLFAMYEKLGFSPLYCLCAEIDGKCRATDFGESRDALFKIYQASFQFPQKSRALFDAAIDAHLAYGGKIKLYKSTAILTNENGVCDVFAPTPSEAVIAAKHAIDGRFKAVLPLNCLNALAESQIKFTKNKIAMAKNINHLQIYINTLFN